jgi:UDP-N-acetylglucosamine/UDP-N-acetylgalactosamine diphosphorylase
MLASSPIFLGGQGGLVGPRRIAFGTVVAAGTIMRRDVLKPDRLIFGQNTSRLKEVSYDLSAYGDVRRILKNNFIYIANLHALYAWYGFVRPGLMQADMYAQAALEGAKRQIEAMVNERIKRIDQLTAKVAASLEKTGITGGVTQSQSDFVNSWSQARAQLQLNRDGGDEQLREAFLAELQPGDGGYLENLRRQSSAAKDAGLLWLENIVKRVSSMDF